MKLAILLYGLESENDKLKIIMDKLQEQLNKLNTDLCEVVFKVNEEESVEEKKAWLLSQTEAKKYVFITAKTEIPDNFLIYRFTAVRAHKPTEKLIELGIFSK